MTRRDAPRRLVVGVVLTSVVLAGVLGWEGTDRSWTAELTHASGLSTGDEVRVAGVPVGSVTEVELDGEVARVGFEIDEGVEMTVDATASVKLATLLGRTYLEVVPGSGPAASDHTITSDRTTPAYTISQLVTDTDTAVGGLDVGTLDAAVDAGTRLLDAVDPDTMTAALDGTVRLADVVSGQDAELRRLLDLVTGVTATVAGQSDQIAGLIDDAAVVSQLVVERRDTLQSLVTAGQQAVTDLDVLASTNRTALTDVLAQLDVVLAVMQANTDQLDLTLERLPAMSRYFANATGNGPWIDVYSPYFLLPDTLVCTLDGACG